MKFNVRVVDFQFATPSPDPAAPKAVNTAYVQAVKGTPQGRKVYAVPCGDEVYGVGEKLRVSVSEGKTTLVSRGTS
jgi:hypothetical protein